MWPLSSGNGLSGLATKKRTFFAASPAGSGTSILAATMPDSPRYRISIVRSTRSSVEIDHVGTGYYTSRMSGPTIAVAASQFETVISILKQFLVTQDDLN